MSAFQIQSSEVLARLKPFGISFEKSLNDLIKGIRTHSKDSPEALSSFLNDAIQECKDELVTTDLEVKATAVLKLAYLEMYGFDMSWCNFHILEVMSSSKFQQKRIGYLAATQSFKSEQDLLILATNQFKKDLNSHNHIEVGLALSGIATIVTPNLAKDIVDDILMKLTHSKPYIRKKSVLALYKIFLKYPESWKAALPRVIEKLDDPDVGVVSATITVVCEISKKHPQFFIEFLPKFFTILEDTSNNWLIIRILKLFQSLSKIEPRMKKKIMPSIVSLMSKTDATSLIYESINCIVDGGMISSDSSRDKEVAKMCVDHLLKFFHQNDSNLRFVGLLALIKILHVFPSFIHKSDEVSSVINLCIQDNDLIIKRKALEICHYLATEDNIANLVKTLLLQILPENTSSHCPGSFKLEITSKILEIASSNNYSNIPNFKWYVTALKELLNLTLLAQSTRLVDDGDVTLSQDISTEIARKLGREFTAIAIRVPSIRPYIMSKVVMEYLQNVKLLKLSPCLMKDLYWIMGEYSDDYGYFENEEGDDEKDLTTSLGQKVTVFNLLVNRHIDEKLSKGAMFPISHELSGSGDADVVSSAIEALIKLYSSIVTDYQGLYSRDNELSYDKSCELTYFLIKLVRFLEPWEPHTSYEVQERCSSWLEFLRLCLDSLKLEDAPGVKKLEKDELKYYQDLSVKAAQDDLSESESERDESSSDSDSDVDDDSSHKLEDARLEGEATRGYSKSFDGDTRNSSDEGKLDDSQADEFTSRQLPTLLAKILRSFFKCYALNPISSSAQSRIQVPENLDLESEICLPPSYCLESDSQPALLDFSDGSGSDSDSPDESAIRGSSSKERKERLENDPYYIKSSTKKKMGKSKSRVLSLDSEAGGAISRPISEAPSLIDLSEEVRSTSKKPKKVKKEKVLVLAEDTLGLEEDSTHVDAQLKKDKKPRKNKLIIDSLDLDSLDINSSNDAKETVTPYDYDVDLNKLRSQYADDAVKKTRKEKAKTLKKKDRRKLDKKAESTGTQSSRVEEEPGLSGSIETDQHVVGVSHVTTDTLISVPQKTKKKKKRAIIKE